MTGKSFCSVLFCFLVGALPHFVGSSFPGGDANDWPDRFGSWPHCSRVGSRSIYTCNSRYRET